MPTVIDSLIVQLGLDASQMSGKSKAAVKQLQDLETKADETEQSVKKIGDTSKRTAGGIDMLTKAAASLLAVIGGAAALKAFVLNTINSGAAIDRLSKNLGLSVETISAWGNAVEQVGGNAKGLQGTLDLLSRSQTELRVTGTTSLIPYFSNLGIALSDAAGKALPVDNILLQLASRFEHMDRTQANNIGRMIGIDQDTLNLLLLGRKELELTLARQKEATVITKRQAEEDAKLQRTIVGLKQEFAAFGRGLLQQAAPALEKLLALFKTFGDWVSRNGEFIGDFLKVLGVGLAAIALVTLPINATVVGILALAAAIALLWQDYQVWKRGGKSFIDWSLWETGIKAATKGITALKDAVVSLWEALKKLKDNPWINGILNLIAPQGKSTSQAFDKFAKGSSLGKLAAKTMDPKEIKDFFISQGWSPAQAAGITANLITESAGNPDAIGDHGQAFGLGQWHPDRQAAFKGVFGHDIRQSNAGEQLAFVQYELNSTFKKAGDALRGATTAADAGSIVSKLYERPKDREGEASRRGNLAGLLNGVSGASAGVAAAGSGGVGSSDNSVTAKIYAINVYTQATDAKGIAKDIGGTVQDYLFAGQANSGLN